MRRSVRKAKLKEKPYPFPGSYPFRGPNPDFGTRVCALECNRVKAAQSEGESLNRDILIVHLAGNQGQTKPKTKPFFHDDLV